MNSPTMPIVAKNAPNDSPVRAISNPQNVSRVIQAMIVTVIILIVLFVYDVKIINVFELSKPFCDFFHLGHIV